MSHGPILGIDLGTTNSVVAIADESQARVLPTELGHRLIPSVVSFRPDGSILVGEEARERRLIDARNTVYSVKRLIGRPFSAPEVGRAQSRFAFELIENASGGVVVNVRGETYTLTEISAFVLKEIKRVAEVALDHSCSRAVVTVPANFNELQRSATKAAGRVAGIDIARIVNEPTAAALAYGYGATRSERVAIYDLGGGTFDLTLLELEEDVYEVLSTAGDSFLGGDDIDLVIATALAERMAEETGWNPTEDRQAFERVRAAAEWAKCQLSDLPVVKIEVEELGPDSLDLRQTLDRPELEGLIMEQVERSFDVCREALKSAGLRPQELDSVVLVGGSTRIPLVRDRVQRFFGKEPRTEIDPDLVVAQGAAILGRTISGKSERPPPARAGIRKKTAAELARLRERREKRRANLPKQPAFAPTIQVEGPPPLPPEAVVVQGIQQVAGTTKDEEESLTMEIDSGMMEIDSALTDLDALELDLPDHLMGDVLDLPTMDAPPQIDGAQQVGIGGASQSTESGLDGESLFTDEGLPPLPAIEAPRVSSLPSLQIGGSGERHQRGEPTLGFGTGVDAAPIAPPAHIDLADRPAPILMDVTPHALGIELTGGYSQTLIRRHAPIPTEAARVFSTAADDQEDVQIRVCQGEAPRFEDNEPLGQVELTGLPPGPRGTVRLNVTFQLDASGTLDVKAQEVTTGREQTIRINLLGGADDAELQSMTERHSQLVGADE
ncbi:MAG: Hsp70 family protein [Deltaproteobacteria bacterium]|nr:Hsp70 family protein [Deltaproteobacteria bacterium]